MVTTDAIEGMVGERYRFHYDIFADVLYIRLLGEEKIASIGNENDAGEIEFRDEKTDRLIGITIVSWWKRFGQGSLPDSISEIAKRVEPLASRIAA